jgi:ubiquinol-cytochrome c reductase iron-sulfur subunit
VRDLPRRHLLAGAAAGLSIGCSAQARAAYREDIGVASVGEPIEIEDIAPGQWRQYQLEGLPIFVRRLTREQIAAATTRRPTGGEWIVVYGVCTHAGCLVVPGQGSYGGFACYCHGSQYDPLGQVRHGPARLDLAVVPHVHRDGKLVLLGVLPHGLPG